MFMYYKAYVLDRDMYSEFCIISECYRGNEQNNLQIAKHIIVQWALKIHHLQIFIELIDNGSDDSFVCLVKKYFIPRQLE